MAFSGIVLPFPDHGDYGDHARLRRFAPPLPIPVWFPPTLATSCGNLFLDAPIKMKNATAQGGSMSLVLVLAWLIAKG